MTISTQSHSASSQPIGSLSRMVGKEPGKVSGSAYQNVVVRFEKAVPPKAFAKKNTRFAELVARMESDPVHSGGLAEARKWLSAEVLEESFDTIRSLRLGKNWSQQKFAELLGTTQAQVARIEKGNIDPQRSTCKRLREVLEISADKLEEIMDRQEQIFQTRNTK